MAFKIHGGSFRAGTGSVMLGSIVLPRDGGFGSEAISTTELVNVEVVTQQNVKSIGRALGMGGGGALLLGPVGFLGGLILGGNKSEVTFAGYFRDGRSFIATADHKLFAKLQGIASSNAKGGASISTPVVTTASTTPELPRTEAPGQSDGETLLAQATRMFLAMGWNIEREDGSYSWQGLTAQHGRDTIVLRILRQPLDSYQISLLRSSILPQAKTVVVSNVVRNDAQGQGVLVGTIAEGLSLIEQALSGDREQPPEPEKKRRWF